MSQCPTSKATTPPMAAGTPEPPNVETAHPKVQPSFSLQSYLNMVQGSSQSVQDRAGLWATQLSRHGLLQTQSTPLTNRRSPTHEIETRSYTMSPTPTDPANFPAAKLDDIWNQYGPSVAPNTPANANRPPNSKTTPTSGYLAARDVTEDITVSSLPESFMRPLRTYVPLNEDVTLDPNANSQSTAEISQVSVPTLMEQEAKTDNIWRWAGNITRIRTATNYNRVVNKRTLQELEDFETKIEGWAKEYRDFVDDGISRKQPRF